MARGQRVRVRIESSVEAGLHHPGHTGHKRTGVFPSVLAGTVSHMLYQRENLSQPSECESVNCSVVSDSVQPHGL